MNVYVESNFLLELVFEQDEVAACEDLLELAENKVLRLVVPLLALVEPQWTLNNRLKKRQELGRSVEEMHKQLRRNQSLGAESHRLNADLGALLTLCEQQEDRLSRQTRERLFRSAAILPAGASILQDAEVKATTHALEYFDAIMYASVVHDLQTRSGEDSCFINRNSKDFAVPSIRQALAGLNCRFFPSFKSGQAHVRGKLGLPLSP